MNASLGQTVRGSRRRTLGRVGAVLVGIGLVAAGCESQESTSHSKAGVEAVPSVTTAPPTTTPSTTATTAAAPGATAITAGADGLGKGASGPAVQQLRQRLTELRFDVAAGNSFDTATYWAVAAFQKQQGLPSNGRADSATLNQLTTAQVGGAMLPTGEPTRVEIDLKRQMLQYWVNGQLDRVLAVSTGNNKRYCIPKSKGGGCAVAVTPGGSFKVQRKIQGLRVSKLGELYNPVYFNGGIALHGSPSVPSRPASHGCVRIPMVSSVAMHNALAIGTPVYVVGGKTAPVPFDEQVPDDPAPAAAPPTTPPVTQAAAVPAPPTTRPPRGLLGRR